MTTLFGFDPLTLKWRTHGVGFIKAYLSENLRLHIFHKMFLTPGITMHHTHPWNFQSEVLIGELTNLRLEKIDGKPNFNEGTIDCSNFCGIEGEPQPVHLFPAVWETFVPGQIYRQRAYEIHANEAQDGTVTLMERSAERGTAKVYWPIGTEYIDADIGTPTDAQILQAVETANDWRIRSR